MLVARENHLLVVRGIYHKEQMDTVVNTLKLSSVSTAKKSSGSRTITNSNLRASEYIEIEFISHENKQHYLQEPEYTSKQSSYWFDPNEKKASSYVVTDVMNVDVRASEYIQRFHEKNQIRYKDVRI
ncbi:hypothetical protein ACHQM5_005951 [Ranunculus cassubicifolius]